MAPDASNGYYTPVQIHTYEGEVLSKAVEGNKAVGLSVSEARNRPIEPAIHPFPFMPSFIIVSAGLTSPPPLEVSSVEMRDSKCIESESRAILCTFWRWSLTLSLRRNCRLQMKQVCGVDWRCTLFTWRSMSPLRWKVTLHVLISHFNLL